MCTQWIRNYYVSLIYNSWKLMRYMKVNKIIGLLVFIRTVSLSLESLVVSGRSWNVFCWGTYLSTGLADVLRQYQFFKVHPFQSNWATFLVKKLFWTSKEEPFQILLLVSSALVSNSLLDGNESGKTVENATLTTKYIFSFLLSYSW